MFAVQLESDSVVAGSLGAGTNAGAKQDLSVSPDSKINNNSKTRAAANNDSLPRSNTLLSNAGQSRMSEGVSKRTSALRSLWN